MTTTTTSTPHKDRPVRFGRRASPLSKMADFTTGQIADILAVAPRTVSNWCDSGELFCYRLPCRAIARSTPSESPAVSGDRRIPRESLIEFMKARGMQHLLKRIGVHESPYAVGVDCVVPGPLPAGWTACECDYATGLMQIAMTPGVKLVVIDGSVGLGAAKKFAAAVRKKLADESPTFVIVQGDDAAHDDVPAGFDFAFSLPLDASALWAAVGPNGVPS